MMQTFTATGRLEIIGNHTDHQGGHVLAMPTNEKIYAEVSDNNSDNIRIFSEGFEPIELNIFEDNDYEQGTSRALLVGILDGFAKKFGRIQVHNSGWDANIRTEIKPGGGTSSSAAYEVLLARIVNDRHYNNQANPIEIAKIGKYAENEFYGKSCGLQDQLASSAVNEGQLILMDFKDEEPTYELIDFDFEQAGYKIKLIESNTGHADNTHEFESIISDMSEIAKQLGLSKLGDISKNDFLRKLKDVEGKVVVEQDKFLRATHFYDENERVITGTNALKRGDIDTFFKCVNESCLSSENLLKNITPKGVSENNLSKLIAEYRMKDTTVAIKLQGGGFGGNIIVFTKN